MAYVVTAIWRARDGQTEHIRRILGVVARLSTTEPACRQFQAHRSLDDPRLFFLYEQYDDEAGYLAHQRTEHFERHVLGDAVPRLEVRERAFYVTLD